MAILRRGKLFTAILAICIFGCSFQIGDIANRYFKYRTKSQNRLNVVHSMKFPILSTCWGLRETIDFNRLLSKLSPNTSVEELTSNRTSYFDALSNITVRDIFDSTPSRTSILNESLGCLIRFPGRYSMRYNYSSEKCYKYLRIKKYIQRHSICYRVSHINDNQNISVNEYSLSPTEPGLIYKIFPNKTLSNVHFYTAYIHTNDSSTLFDSLSSPIKYIENANNVSFDVSFSPVEVYKKLPPYDTKCTIGIPGFNSATERKLHILNTQTMEVLNHVHDLEPLTIKYDYRLLSPESYLNKSMTKIFNNLPAFKLPMIDYCTFKFNIAKTTVSNTNMLAVGVYWPQDTKIIVQYFAEYELTDFIIYVCSSIGIWFGFSVLSLTDLFQGFTQRLNSGNQDHKSNEVDTINHLHSNNGKLMDEVVKLKKKQTILHCRFVALLEYTQLRFNDHSHSN